MHIRSVLVAAVIAIAGLAVVPSAYADDVDLAAIPAPTVTWPEQTNIGGDNPPYVVQVEDTDDPAAADTYLWATLGGRGWQLSGEGATVLAPQVDAQGQIVVLRCGTNTGQCVDAGAAPSPEVTVRVPPVVTLKPVKNHTTIGGSPLVLPARLSVAPGDYTLDWWLKDAPEVGAQGVPVVVGDTGEALLDLDLTPWVAQLDDAGVKATEHELLGQLTQDVDGFGRLTAYTSEHPDFSVDETAPTISSVKVVNEDVYPAADGYRDQVEVRAHTDDHGRSTVHLDVLDRDGDVVASTPEVPSSKRASWDGTVDGAQAEPGAYTLRVVATDFYGNAASQDHRVRVHPERLVTRTFRRTVSARSSLVDQSAGACSALGTPAHAAAGTLGLYSNVSCSRGVRPSVVVTAHRIRVPGGAFRYRRTTVDVSGGAASSGPRSLAKGLLWRPSHGWEERGKVLRSDDGWHHLAYCEGDWCLDSAHRLVWGVVVGNGARYDIRSFRVSVRYQVLV